MNEEYIARKITELMPDKNRIPQGVLYSKLKSAVQKDLSEALGILLREGKLKYSRTINDILITMSNNEQVTNI